MEWLRHEKYNGLTSGWKFLIGNVDDAWIQFAKDNGSDYMFKKFSDPVYCREKIGTAHWGASMNAVYLKPPPMSPHINHGDCRGWVATSQHFTASGLVLTFLPTRMVIPFSSELLPLL